MKKICLPVALLYIAIGTHAAEVDPPAEAIKAITSAFPGARAEWSKGYLNKDKLQDFATIVNYDGMQYIVALIQSEDRNFTLYKSNEFPGHQRRVDTAKIERGQLIYTFYSSTGCCGHITNEYKFNFHQSDFWLSSFLAESHGLTPDSTPKKLEHYVHSVNADYSTMEIRYELKVGKRHRMIKQKLEALSPKLGNFFGADWDTPDEAIGGHIDSNFHFHAKQHYQ